ncbi:MAG: N-acetylneuraminate synthase family protein [Promethearchaeota archaeon]
MIILDFGSGNSCHNDKTIVKKMLDELKKVDTGKHEIVIKWQLFKEAGKNIPLEHDIFKYAYDYAKKLGYQTTSSVFDKESLDFLLQFDIPFVKIANNRSLDWLMGEIPRKIPIYVSYGSVDELKIAPQENIKRLLCISDYPADIKSYEDVFDIDFYTHFEYGISDHTTNFGLWYRYQPQFIEWHYVLEHDKNNLDGGLFAHTPKQLSEVL